MHSRKSLLYVTILKDLKVSFEKIHLVFQKTQILSLLWIRSIPVAFYSKFATIYSEENFTFRNVNEHRFSANVNDKHCVKKRHKSRIVKKILLP